MSLLAILYYVRNRGLHVDLSTDTGGFVADAVPRGWLFFDMLRVVTIRSILS